jgi:predicted DCC family thiol-disulfide oxidoreductase YuxK
MNPSLPYSYRSDASVPPFPDERPLLVFDGVCVFCSGFIRFVLSQDRQASFRFVIAQSPLGQALYRHYGLDAVDFETNLLLTDGRLYTKLDAFAEVMRRLGGIWRPLSLLRHLPAPVAVCCYDRVARNRYRLFGRRPQCLVPDAALRARVLGA